MQAPEVIEDFGSPVENVGKQSQIATTVIGRNMTEITQTLKGPKGEDKIVMTMEPCSGTFMPKLTSATIITPTGSEIPIKVGGETPTPAPAAGQ